MIHSTLNCDAIERDIMECLDSLAREAIEKNYKKDGIWTGRTKELLAELGNNLGFEACPDKSSGAWLFDFSWYVNNDSDRLIRLPLVVESEWSRSMRCIKYDFEKLLSCNAERRLMICQAKPEMIEPLFQYFDNAIQDYSLSRFGDRYLIAILDDYGSGEFIYKLITKRCVEEPLPSLT